jgi:predicted dehydrogenase
MVGQNRSTSGCEDATVADQRGVVRIGALGAARITPEALVRPAAADPQAEVVAVAARDLDRARRFTAEHKIRSAYGSYEDVLADPDVDAVYIALPNGLHGRWTKAAIRAGKHVLCEKPFAANAEEAAWVAEASRGTGLVVMEAFHYRYHALVARMLEIIHSGELGEITSLAAWLAFPLLTPDDIRWNFSLAGGALMDAGCYPTHLLRTLAGAEPEVRSARARTRQPDVDRLMQAELVFPDGRRASLTASMLSPRLGAGARVTGTRGTMRVLNPYFPQMVHRLSVRSPTRTAVERVPRRPGTYECQLAAFTGAVLRGEPILTGVEDAVANMRVIDACYAAAGLPRREPTL